MKAICKCVNIDFGTYENQVILTTPEGKQVGIDDCIVEEIKHLWELGVTTVASCCGHNLNEGSIAVIKEDYDTMIDLGYIPDYRCDPECCCFYSKVRKS